jgi:hypothetical protein
MTHGDIPRIMEIRHGVHENRLRDATSVTAADCAAFVERAAMWVWVEGGQICGSFILNGSPSCRGRPSSRSA